MCSVHATLPWGRRVISQLGTHESGLLLRMRHAPRVNGTSSFRAFRLVTWGETRLCGCFTFTLPNSPDTDSLFRQRSRHRNGLSVRDRCTLQSRQLKSELSRAHAAERLRVYSQVTGSRGVSGRWLNIVVCLTTKTSGNVKNVTWFKEPEHFEAVS